MTNHGDYFGTSTRGWVFMPDGSVVKPSEMASGSSPQVEAAGTADGGTGVDAAGKQALAKKSPSRSDSILGLVVVLVIVGGLLFWAGRGVYRYYEHQSQANNACHDTYGEHYNEITGNCDP